MRRTPVIDVPKPRQVDHPILERLMAAGAKEASAYTLGRCTVFVALEPMGFSTSPIEHPGDLPLRWHLSIAHPARYPLWDEIVKARDCLLPHDRAFAQLLPGSWDEWINIHNYCFHLWEVRDEAG